MFKKARIELTAWYLVIIMSISILFSGWIYRSVSMDLERRLIMIEHRFQTEDLGFRKPKMITGGFKEDLKAARKALVLILVWANGAILVFSGGAGWFLAKKTLEPIEKSLEEQKRFVADASHELRTPLTALKTSIEVALRNKRMTKKEAEKVIADSLYEVDGLSSLTEKLLTLAQYENGKNKVDWETVDMGQAIRKAIKKMTGIAQKKGIKLENKLQKGFLTGDRERLEELVMIFVDNAIKYSKKGGKVKVSLRENGKYLILKIKDEGVGIEEKDISHIFDRFYKADQSRSKQRGDGFGLGLSVAKKIAETHNGIIRVKSRVGKGSEFEVKFLE